MKITPGRWYRTCQECGHQQAAKQPPAGKELTDSYRNAKCRKCHSEALDYGTTMPRPSCWGCGDDYLAKWKVSDLISTSTVVEDADPYDKICPDCVEELEVTK